MEEGQLHSCRLCEDARLCVRRTSTEWRVASDGRQLPASDSAANFCAEVVCCDLAVLKALMLQDLAIAVTGTLDSSRVFVGYTENLQHRELGGLGEVS